MLGRNYQVVSVPRMGSIRMEWDEQYREVHEFPGPWQYEPDIVVWRDDYTGLLCRINRNPVGALCGYVSVPNDWAGPLDVHGGITFDGTDLHDSDLRWVGFDCSHAGDLSPISFMHSGIPDRLVDTYKDIDYLYREVISMAAQAALYVAS